MKRLLLGLLLLAGLSTQAQIASTTRYGLIKQGSGVAVDQTTGFLSVVTTGDVTSAAGSSEMTIAADAVTNAKMANVATNTIKGRTTAGTGDPEDMTASQVRSLLGLATVATSGSASDLTAGTLPAGRLPAHTGDATSSAGSAALTVTAVNGVTVSGTPSSGQVITATSGTAAAWATPSAGTGPTIAALAADAATSSGTLGDVTGSGISVTSGTYWFRWTLHFTSSSGTSSAQLSLNGPTTSALGYTISTPGSATSRVFSEKVAYNSISAAPTYAAASSGGNIAFIEGSATFTASGTLIPRFSNANGATITVKAYLTNVQYYKTN